MKESDDLYAALGSPVPRPLGPVLRGPAFKNAIILMVIAIALITVAMLDLWRYLSLHYGEPLLGNERLVAAYIVFFLSIVGFIFFWTAGFMNLYSIHLYRTASLQIGRVEKSHFQEKRGKRFFVVGWILEKGGTVARGAIPFPVAENSFFAPEIVLGDHITLLAQGGNIFEAIPVGTLGLRKEWTLAPSLSLPVGFVVLRWVTVFALIALVSIAAIGMSSSWLLDDTAPLSLVVAATATGLVPAAIFWLASRRLDSFFYPPRYLWVAALFACGFFAGYGIIKGLNVWTDPEPPLAINAEILHLDDALLPSLHRYAFVRSWREGKIKEKIPLPLSLGIGLIPGETLRIEVRRGAFGMPAVTEVFP